jgi:hypothetical protein
LVLLMIQKIKSQIFILAIVSFLLFVAVCYILLGVFWRPLYLLWAAMSAYFRYQSLFYYLLLISFASTDVIVVGLSFILFKNKRIRIYFCMFTLTIVFAIFFSFLFMHLHSLCYI